MTTGKIIALTVCTFVGKVMSLLLNMLSQLVITFLPRSKCLLISWLQSSSTVTLEPKKIKSVTVSLLFPHLSAMKWWDWMPWSLFFQCWVLSQLFHSPPSLSKRGSYFLFTFCHKGGVICISEVIGISPSNLDFSFCSSSPAFHMIYSGYKLTMQCDNIQLWCALSQFGTSPLFHVWFCYFLTCIQIFRRQIKQSGIQISLRIFQFVVIHTETLV